MIRKKIDNKQPAIGIQTNEKNRKTIVFGYVYLDLI